MEKQVLRHIQSSIKSLVQLVLAFYTHFSDDSGYYYPIP